MPLAHDLLDRVDSDGNRVVLVDQGGDVDHWKCGGGSADPAERTL